MSGAEASGAQTTLLKSEEGTQYRMALYDGVNAYKQSL